MTAFRPTHLTLALGAALSALLCAPVHAQSLMELVESARTYDTTWQAARAQLEAAARRADQAQAGLRSHCTAPPTALPWNRANAAWTWPRRNWTRPPRTCWCA